jgi:hypothetical protein
MLFNVRAVLGHQVLNKSAVSVVPMVTSSTSSPNVRNFPKLNASLLNNKALRLVLFVNLT